MKDYIFYLAMILIISFYIFGKCFLSSMECHSRWDEAKYSPVSGCMVKINDSYIHESNVRVIRWVYEEDEGAV